MERVTAASVRRGLRTQLIGRRVLCLAEASSTMDVALRLARAGALEGAVVVAETQTAGRGRFGRRWVSPPGVNLYVSMVLRPSLRELPQLSMVAAVATARAIQAATGLQARIKWPNDLLLRGRKVTGILVEAQTRPGQRQVAVVGIGLNVNLAEALYPEIAGTATSLREQVGRPVSRLAVLQALLQELDRVYGVLRRGGSVHQEWRGLLETLGRRIRVRWGQRVEVGRAVGVDRTGSLILERADGTTVVLPAGEVTVAL